MAADQQAQSGRARRRAATKARKEARLAWSQSSFELLACGYSPEQIADVRKVNVRTIRREIAAAIARRQLDAPEQYVHLQVARLTKALRFADAALERGELKAVRSLVQVVSAMDRYHGFRQFGRGRVSPGLRRSPELHVAAGHEPPSQLFHVVSPSEEAPGQSEAETNG